MSTTFAIGITFTPITCCREGCGLTFAVPCWWETHRRDDHAMFYCPNGHGQHFTGQTDAEKERKRAELAERRAERAEQNAESNRNWAQAEARRAVALKGVVTRTKNRIAAGKCPCCRERFANLKAHMDSEHPSYATP